MFLRWSGALGASVLFAAVLQAQELPRDDVPAAIGEARSTAVPDFSAFRPSVHGFAFVNSFSGSPAPVALGALERRLKVPDRFGLCGGMCFAAADFYIAARSLREEVPDAMPPEGGTPLFDYVYARQAASLGTMFIMASRFLEWMQLPEEGEGGTHARTLQELVAIIDAVGAGEPVMLGLVLVSAGGADAGEPWRNHQVLAYGLAEGVKEGGLPVFRIYDPNYPGRDDVVIRWVEDSKGRWERVVPRRSITPVRGFFRMPYGPQEPPRLGGPAAAPGAPTPAADAPADATPGN
jgi:hypothetical protein